MSHKMDEAFRELQAAVDETCSIQCEDDDCKGCPFNTSEYDTFEGCNRMVIFNAIENCIGD